MNEETAPGYESLDKLGLISLLAERDEEISKLQHYLYLAKKEVFGPKSERRPLADERQEALFSFEPLPESKEEHVAVKEHSRIKRGRKPLPKHLPREETIHQPKETHCPSCNNELVEIGRETTEILEKIPAKLYVQEHVKVKKSCPCCKDAVYSGSIPAGVQPLERRRPGPGLLADIIVRKFCDHLPLHRQEEIFLREGAEISRQRMSEWIGELCVTAFTLLHHALLKEILLAPYVQADETSLDVQDRSTDKNLVTGWLWAVHKPPDLVYFHYAHSRAGEVPKVLFKDYHGVVQTDLYAGYDVIYLPEHCARVACMAHVRRKFVEIEKLAQKECGYVLTLISRLYKIERDIKTKDRKERLSARQERSKKILDELRAYLTIWRQRTLPKSPVTTAIDYVLCQWEEIERYTTAAEFEIDNNSIERQIRPIALGRKNWLFAGSHDGARHAAILYSLINTCKLNSVNPYEYLRDVIARIYSHPTSRIAELLPHRWKLAK